MNIFIFGSSGYIGSKLALSLKKKFPQIVKISRNTNADINYNLEDIDRLNYDVFDKDGLVIFCTSISSPQKCEDNPKKSIKVNINFTTKVINKILNKNCKIIFLSSDNIYGETKYKVSEKSIPKPNNNYGKWKLKIEKNFSKHRNFKSLRLSQVWSEDSKFYTENLEKLKFGKTIKSFDNFYRMSVNFDYVFNVVLFCIENWKKIRYKNLNVGGKSLLSRYDLMIKIFPKKYSSLILKSQADECFFKYRPRIINMSSDYIEKKMNQKVLP